MKIAAVGLWDRETGSHLRRNKGKKGDRSSLAMAEALRKMAQWCGGPVWRTGENKDEMNKKQPDGYKS